MKELPRIEEELNDLKAINRRDNLTEKGKELLAEYEYVVKLVKENELLHNVSICSREGCEDVVSKNSNCYCIEHAYQHKMEGY